MFDLPKYGDGICLARMAGVAGSARNRSRAAAANLGGGDRLERQGQYGGDVRSNRPRLWSADRPVHVAASLPFQRTDSGRWRRDRRRRAGSPETAGRSCHRNRLAEDGRKIRRVRSAVCAGLPALPGERMRLRRVRGRHRRPLRSGPPRRRARDLRHFGRLRACRIARQLAGADRIRQERRLRCRRHDRLWRELPSLAAASRRI